MKTFRQSKWSATIANNRFVSVYCAWVYVYVFEFECSLTKLLAEFELEDVSVTYIRTIEIALDPNNNICSFFSLGIVLIVMVMLYFEEKYKNTTCDTFLFIGCLVNDLNAPRISSDSLFWHCIRFIFVSFRFDGCAGWLKWNRNHKNYHPFYWLTWRRCVSLTLCVFVNNSNSTHTNTNTNTNILDEKVWTMLHTAPMFNAQAPARTHILRLSMSHI